MYKSNFFSKLNGRKKLFLGFITVGITSPVILAACGNSQIGSNSQNSHGYISVGLTNPFNSRWQKVQTALQEAIQSYDYKPSNNIFSHEQDQNNFLNNLINQTYILKGFVVGGSGDSMATVASVAKKNNIPLVAYDSLINNSDDYNYYVTFDNSLIGEIQGLAAVSKLLGYKKDGEDAIFQSITEMENFYYTGNVEVPRPANTNQYWYAANKKSIFSNLVYYYVAPGNPNDNNSKLFYDGQIKVMQKLYEITHGMFRDIKGWIDRGEPKGLDYSTFANNWWKSPTDEANYWAPKKREEKDFEIYQLLYRLPGLKILLAPNDELAQSLISAYEPYGSYDNWPIVTGEGSNNYALKSIQEGKQFMTIYKSDEKLAKVAIAVLMELIKNPNQSPYNILTNVKQDKNIAPFASELNLNATSYKPENTFIPENAIRAVNAFVLRPEVITKNNWSDVK